MGVRRAMDNSLEALEKYKNKKVYSLGPVIHNQTALDYLSKKGLCILQEDQIDLAQEESVVIIRAHGVPPKVIEKLNQKKCIIINATCPRVVASQKLVEQYSLKNYTVILAGDKNHGEVTGIAGYAKNKFILVQNEIEADNIKLQKDEKVILLSQTTFSPVEFNKISEKIKKQINDVYIVNSICPATQKRQDSLISLCPKVDAVIVVGGKNSANTKRLLQTALSYSKNAILIEDFSEIPKEYYSYKTVGVTAGASTPDSVIYKVKNALENSNKV